MARAGYIGRQPHVAKKPYVHYWWLKAGLDGTTLTTAMWLLTGVKNTPKLFQIAVTKIFIQINPLLLSQRNTAAIQVSNFCICYPAHERAHSG